MDIEVARHMVRVGLRCGRELESLLVALKSGLAEEEYRPIAKAVALAVHEIHNATLESAYSSHPNLEAEVEAHARKYGHYL